MTTIVIALVEKPAVWCVDRIDTAVEHGSIVLFENHDDAVHFHTTGQGVIVTEEQLAALQAQTAGQETAAAGDGNTPPSAPVTEAELLADAAALEPVAEEQPAVAEEAPAPVAKTAKKR